MSERCPSCQHVASEWQWEFVSDAQTGTVYMRCPKCGAHVLCSPRGFVDWHAGLFVGSSHVMGSEWTQQVGGAFLAELSKLSKSASSHGRSAS